MKILTVQGQEIRILPSPERRGLYYEVEFNKNGLNREAISVKA